MAESFSSPGDVTRQVPNQADKYGHPNPYTPAEGWSYDKDNYEVVPILGEILTPEYDRCYEYGTDNDDSETAPQHTPDTSDR